MSKQKCAERDCNKTVMSGQLVCEEHYQEEASAPPLFTAAEKKLWEWILSGYVPNLQYWEKDEMETLYSLNRKIIERSIPENLDRNDVTKILGELRTKVVELESLVSGGAEFGEQKSVLARLHCLELLCAKLVTCDETTLSKERIDAIDESIQRIDSQLFEDKRLVNEKNDAQDECLRTLARSVEGLNRKIRGLEGKNLCLNQKIRGLRP
jgi:hypothetical protein